MKHFWPCRWCWLIGLVAAVACNGVGLIATGGATPSPNSSSTPTTPPPTVTPPQCATPTVGPPPYVSTTSATGNWDFCIDVADDADSDGNACKLAWLCAPDPLDPFPPHEVFQRADLSAGDGDFNAWICTDPATGRDTFYAQTSGTSPYCPDFSWSCCAVQPTVPPHRWFRGKPRYYEWEVDRATNRR